MFYNRQSFNKGAYYNRTTPSTTVSLAGTSAMAFTATATNMHVTARYGNTTTGIVFGGSADLATDLPIMGEAGIVFDDIVKFSADAYCAGEIGITFDAIASAIRVANDQEIALEGLQFKPGDTIIIDTETLDVFYNGEPDVSSWVVGSDFFQLGKGMNTLTFYDDAASRELTVTVIWADRWL